MHHCRTDSIYIEDAGCAHAAEVRLRVTNHHVWTWISNIYIRAPPIASRASRRGRWCREFSTRRRGQGEERGRGAREEACACAPALHVKLCVHQQAALAAAAAAATSAGVQCCACDDICAGQAAGICIDEVLLLLLVAPEVGWGGAKPAE